MSSDCGERTVLVDIPGAENILFTPEGRLFITAGSGLYEVHQESGHKAGEAYSAQQLSAEGFTGIAQRGNVLYAVCGQSLCAGDLGTGPQMMRIFDFTGMCIPNGMALGPDEHLYVVDEPLNVSPPNNCLPPDPKIVRLLIDPTDPFRVLGQEVWIQGSPLGLLFLGLDNVLRFPNGLVRQGNTFFGTDGGSIFKVEWQPDGSAGPVVPIFFEPTAHDDLGLAGDDALVIADFLTGRIFLLSQDGELLQETDRLLFTLPSSTRLGRPPMFAPEDVVVTERIVVADSVLPLGQLSVFRKRQ